jgi:hypothetical protein
MNKKALMLKFLTVVILALIIFAPTCMFTSKLFQKSSQAVQSFEDLAKTVNEINKKPLGTTETLVYIQDSGTYFYQINNKSRNFLITQDELTRKKLNVRLSYSELCETKNCLCLCRDTKSETDLTCVKQICLPTAEVNFSPGTGIFLFRGTGTYANLVPRRQVVKVIKCKKDTDYCKNSEDGDVSIIFNFKDGQGGYSAIGGKSDTRKTYDVVAVPS